LTARQELIKVYARQLKLPTLTSCQEVIRQAEEQGLSYEEFLCEVLRRELSQREENQKKSSASAIDDGLRFCTVDRISWYWSLV